MRVSRYVLGAGIVAAALTLAACAGSSGSTSSSSTGTSAIRMGGAITVTQGTAPDSLDPGKGYTTQGNEADEAVYTPLLAYAAKAGTAGAQLVPGLAKALPTVSSDNKTYTLNLRSGLKYSDGTAVKASDFTFAVERSFRVPWGGDGLYSGLIQGASAYLNHKATSISGIKTNDSTGQITITLTQPYGAFPNILAFVALAPVPKNTPMTAQSANPPIGDGPYKFGTIKPNHSYELVKNPNFKSQGITTVPNGYADTITVSVNSNTTAEAESVLNNQQDLFDPADDIPSGILTQLGSKAQGRYSRVSLASTYYFFLNTKVAPFNNATVRKAVVMATDRTALQRLSAGGLTPGCYFLPPTIAGHQSGGCPNAPNPSSPPSASTVAKAKSMIKSAGVAGQTVQVWSEQRQPRTQYVQYWANLLQQLGFKTTIKQVADTAYFPTIGKLSLHPQTGFADWSQDFPDPSDFYYIISKEGILPTGNQNFGEINDSKIESALAKLNPVPSTKLDTVASQWANLDTYVAQQAYVNVFGYSTAPKFMSNRVDFNRAIFNPVYYIMFPTIALKK